MLRTIRWDGRLTSLKRIPGCLTWPVAGRRHSNPDQVVHIVEAGDWVIRRIGRHIAHGVAGKPFRFTLDTSPRFLRNALVHFGSISTFVAAAERSLHRSNRCVATMYHGDRRHSSAMDRQIDAILEHRDRLDRIIVSNSIMHSRLVDWGIDERRLSLIPIGVDLSLFTKMQPLDRDSLRRQFGIPDDAVCIGSFQKDGNGWGEGLEPKLIKGPDVFVQAVTELAKQRKVHCLLTGPARGYVKTALERSGIPFTHRYLQRYEEIVDCYACLDLYLVTSREEGGPMAITESMAAGVPLVSTRVGMAADLIRQGENGFVVAVGDTASLVEHALQLLADDNLRNRVVENGRRTALDYDWNVVTRQIGGLYRELLAKAA